MVQFTSREQYRQVVGEKEEQSLSPSLRFPVSFPLCAEDVVRARRLGARVEPEYHNGVLVTDEMDDADLLGDAGTP